MALIGDMISSFTNRRKKVDDLDENIRVTKMAEQKQKSSNERELERFMEEQRQKNIDAQLAAFRKEKSEQMFKSNIFKPENSFNHKATVTNNGSMNMMGKSEFFKGGNML